MDQQPATPTVGDFYTARWGVEQTNVDFSTRSPAPAPAACGCAPSRRTRSRRQA